MGIKDANSSAECGTFSTTENYSLPLGETLDVLLDIYVGEISVYDYISIEPNFILQGIFFWYSFNSYWIFPKCNYCAIWERLYLILLRNFPRPIYYFRKSCHQWLLSVVFELPILSTVPVHFITSCVARSKHLHNEIYIILLKIILFLPLRHHTDIFKNESNYESI